MVSMRSVRNSIDEARGAVLILMQEGTEELGVTDDWGFLMSEVYELLQKAGDLLTQAELGA